MSKSDTKSFSTDCSFTACLISFVAAFVVEIPPSVTGSCDVKFKRRSSLLVCFEVFFSSLLLNSIWSHSSKSYRHT